MRPAARPARIARRRGWSTAARERPATWSPEPETPAYDADFFEWTQHTAALLRAGRVGEVDVEHLAEEVEDMGKRDRWVLQDSPSLRTRVGTELRRTYGIAVARAVEVSGVFRDRSQCECPWTPEQILDRNFLPDD